MVLQLQKVNFHRQLTKRIKMITPQSIVHNISVYRKSIEQGLCLIQFKDIQILLGVKVNLRLIRSFMVKRILITF